MVPLLNLREVLPPIFWMVICNIYGHYYLNDHLGFLFRYLIIVTVSLAGWMLAFQIFSTKFELDYVHNERNEERLKKCPALKRQRYFHTPYLPYGWSQAMYDHYFVSSLDHVLNYQKDVANLGHGVKMNIEYVTLKNPVVSFKEKHSLVIVVPGITGTSKDFYMQQVALDFLNNGYKVMILCSRWTGETLSIANATGVNVIEDFKHFIDWVKEQHPDESLFAIGHSYGANTILNYLGKYCNNPPIKAAVSIGNPFDLWTASNYICSTIWDQYLVADCKKVAQKYEKEIIEHEKKYNINMKRVMNAKNMRDFDDQFTRRVLGMHSVDHYYHTYSSSKRLPTIKTPVLCINAIDDPIIPAECIPKEEALDNPNLFQVTTRCGSHVHFFTGFFKPRRWYTTPAVEFIDAIREENLHDAKKE